MFFYLLVDECCLFCSFTQGDVFVVENVIDTHWLWVTAQKNNEKGLVLTDLVEDAVSEQTPKETLSKNSTSHLPPKIK